MRSLGVVEASPLLDQHLRLLQRVEDFHIQTLIPELAVEALIDFELGFEILPGTKVPAKAKVAKKGPFEQDLRVINE